MKVYTFLGKNHNYSLIGEDQVDVTAIVRCFDGSSDEVLGLDQKFIDHLRTSGFKDGSIPKHGIPVIRVNLAEELLAIKNLEKAEAERESE